MLFKRPLVAAHLYLLLLNMITLAQSELPNDITVNCVSSGNLNGNLGREWIGDIGSELIVTSQRSKEKLLTLKEFNYGFEVGLGQKFVCLYFFPAMYAGFKRSKGLFTVKAVPYTLLSNFNASQTADALVVNYFKKKFCVHLVGKLLQEIVLMPPGLYCTPVGEPGVHLIGKRYQLLVDESVALEMIHWLNVGRNFVSSAEDTGLSRERLDDSTYLCNSDVQEFRKSINFKHRTIPTYTAQKFYQTSWAMVLNEKLNKAYNFAWKLLHLSLGPKCSNNYDWWTKVDDMILKGFEVLKFSNIDTNLISIMQDLPSCKPKSRKFVYANGGNSIATIIILVISFLSIILYHLRVLSEQDGDDKISPSPSPSPSEGLSRRFSLYEVRSATNNFDNLLVIGRGGFGLVYKGVINGGAKTVAVKRLNSKSQQGADEFWTEIEMLSTLRHNHLVSLIGYCDEDREMILVYEYVEHGSLADHLYKIRSNGGTNFDLSWEQKLNICIGAARGLDYLHTSTRRGVIHRDVKTTNILLDNEWGAKISDFGLCKVGTTSNSCSHVSTNVKGTFGYLDPGYFLTRRLTKKSDVYAFGVVLLETLCGRPAVDISLKEDRHSLALWAQHCIKEGKLDELVDSRLKDIH